MAVVRSGDNVSGHSGGRPIHDRFAPEVQPAVARLLAASRHYSELSTTFPGLLFVVATTSPRTGKFRRLSAMIERERPLRQIASAAGLPFWMRRLPPEAFTVEADLALPVSPRFSKRIVNHLPDGNSDPAMWMSSIAFAATACHEHFALWLARQPVFEEVNPPEELFGLLAAFAWHSDQTAGPARRLIGRPWQPGMAMASAVFEASSWLNRMMLCVQSSAAPARQPWIAEAEVDGYRFLPLLSADEILSEATALNHCIDQMGLAIARGQCALFSMQKNGQRLATVEVQRRSVLDGTLQVSEIKGRHNAEVPREWHETARRWIAATQPPPGQITGNFASPPILPPWPQDNQTWTALMAAYRRAKGRLPWLPETFTLATYAGLRQQLVHLADQQGLKDRIFRPTSSLCPDIKHSSEQ